MSYIQQTIKCTKCGHEMNIALGTFGTGLPKECPNCQTVLTYEVISDGWNATSHPAPERKCWCTLGKNGKILIRHASCPHHTTPPAPEEKVFKNGHLLDAEGKLVFDPECHNCDAPTPEPTRVHGSSFNALGGVLAEDSLDNMVRDFCSVVPRSKSEVRRRILAFVGLSQKATNTPTPQSDHISQALEKVAPAEFVIVPSGRQDYCCECKAVHGYDCPKDAPAPEWDWEAEFDEEFGVIEPGIIPFSEQFSADNYKTFIRQTLSHQATQLMEVVAGMKKRPAADIPSVEPNRVYEMDVKIHNAALSDVLSELKKLI